MSKPANMLPKLMIYTEDGPLIVVHSDSRYHSAPACDVPSRAKKLKQIVLEKVWGVHRPVDWFCLHSAPKDKH